MGALGNGLLQALPYAGAAAGGAFEGLQAKRQMQSQDASEGLRNLLMSLQAQQQMDETGPIAGSQLRAYQAAFPELTSALNPNLSKGANKELLGFGMERLSNKRADAAASAKAQMDMQQFQLGEEGKDRRAAWAATGKGASGRGGREADPMVAARADLKIFADQLTKLEREQRAAEDAGAMGQVEQIKLRIFHLKRHMQNRLDVLGGNGASMDAPYPGGSASVAPGASDTVLPSIGQAWGPTIDDFFAKGR